MDNSPETKSGMGDSRWRSKFGGMEVSEAKRLKALEEENRQLKQLLAEKELDNLGLRTALSKKY